MRPSHWIKNLFLFAGLIFSQRLFITSDFLTVCYAFIAFSLVASGTYLFNDLMDLEQDRQNPLKKVRPLPMGILSPPTALMSGLILIILGIALSAFLSPAFLDMVLVYFVLNLLYTVALKKVIIIDMLTVASGYVIRAIAGAVVIGVEISSWLLVCTILVSLLLVLGKRRQEFLNIDQPYFSRPVLMQYSLQFLDNMINVIAASTITAYFLYTFSSDTIQKFGSKNLEYTIIFVLYGIFRYLFLLHKQGIGEEPIKILFSDIPFLINFILWTVSVVIIIYII
ncbi:decaprenyl-phosphate phosphoribosyltransferase [bacterium]|nr:decaprenyl-phosphate phosphoribosyltransferase [bacterium]